MAENARAKLQRSSRTGPGAGTAPVGNLTTTVTPSFGSRPVAAKAPVRPSVSLEAHDRVEPTGPTWQATWPTGAGALTVTAACSIGTSQSAPMAFQYSSSWSGNPSSVPSIR